MIYLELQNEYMIGKMFESKKQNISHKWMTFKDLLDSGLNMMEPIKNGNLSALTVILKSCGADAGELLWKYIDEEKVKVDSKILSEILISVVCNGRVGAGFMKKWIKRGLPTTFDNEKSMIAYMSEVVGLSGYKNEFSELKLEKTSFTEMHTKTALYNVTNVFDTLDLESKYPVWFYVLLDGHTPSVKKMINSMGKFDVLNSLNNSIENCFFDNANILDGATKNSIRGSREKEIKTAQWFCQLAVKSPEYTKDYKNVLWNDIYVKLNCQKEIRDFLLQDMASMKLFKWQTMFLSDNLFEVMDSDEDPEFKETWKKIILSMAHSATNSNAKKSWDSWSLGLMKSLKKNDMIKSLPDSVKDNIAYRIVTFNPTKKKINAARDLFDIDSLRQALHGRLINADGRGSEPYPDVMKDGCIESIIRLMKKFEIDGTKGMLGQRNANGFCVDYELLEAMEKNGIFKDGEFEKKLRQVIDSPRSPSTDWLLEKLNGIQVESLKKSIVATKTNLKESL